MIERAIADGLPAGLVLADSAYGETCQSVRSAGVRCEGWLTPWAYTRTTTVCALGFCSVTPEADGPRGGR